jgi:Metallo-beta-lactamase superfamily
MRPQRFGAVTVQKVAELPSLAVDRNWLIGNATAEGVEQERSWLGPEFIEPASGRLLISVHSFLVRTPRLTLLVDTCCGNGRDRGPDSPFHRLSTGYLVELERAGVRPEEVDLVFCTHLHVDHVGWWSCGTAASRQLFPTPATCLVARISSTDSTMTAVGKAVSRHARPFANVSSRQRRLASSISSIPTPASSRISITTSHSPRCLDIAQVIPVSGFGATVGKP